MVRNEPLAERNKREIALPSRAKSDVAVALCCQAADAGLGVIDLLSDIWVSGPDRWISSNDNIAVALHGCHSDFGHLQFRGASDPPVNAGCVQ